MTISIYKIWWRRRESNPRPKAPMDGFYMLSSFLILPPFQKEQKKWRKVLLISLLTARTTAGAIPLSHTFKAPWEKALKMATYSLRQREHKSLHLIFSALINERNGISACYPSFQCLCRAHFAPSGKEFHQIFKDLILNLSFIIQ